MVLGNFSDLECAGGLLLWLVIEQVLPTLENKHIGLLNDNSPTFRVSRK